MTIQPGNRGSPRSEWQVPSFPDFKSDSNDKNRSESTCSLGLCLYTKVDGKAVSRSAELTLSQHDQCKTNGARGHVHSSLKNLSEDAAKALRNGPYRTRAKPYRPKPRNRSCVPAAQEPQMDGTATKRGGAIACCGAMLGSHRGSRSLCCATKAPFPALGRGSQSLRMGAEWPS